jgi:hypothetical protein
MFDSCKALVVDLVPFYQHECVQNHSTSNDLPSSPPIIRLTNEGKKEVQEVPSVYAGENPDDAFCAMCSDKFEQFFNDEMQEWHLHGAVRVEGKTFHPLCCEDYKVSIFVMMLPLL